MFRIVALAAAAALVLGLGACRRDPPLPVVACVDDDDCAVGAFCDPASRRCLPRTLDAGVAPADTASPVDAAAALCEVAHTCEVDEDCPVGTCTLAHDVRLGGVLGIARLPDEVAAPVVHLAPAGLCRARTGCDLVAAGIGEDDRCGACARCVLTAEGAACRPRCTTDADCGDTTLVCDAALGVCIEGCSSDAECRVARADGGLPGRRDRTGLDRLTYDSASSATCAAGRCERPGAPDVRVGARCARDSECGQDQVCVAPPRAWNDPTAPWCNGLDCEAFAAGFCTHVGCDAEGHACNADEVCVRRPRLALAGAADGTVAFCARACLPGSEGPLERLGPSGHGAGCDVGQACVPERDERSAALVGACLPGVYDDVRTPNVGRSCRADEECYSPHGLGRCDPLVPWAPETYAARVCTITDCDRLPDGACGTGASCQLLRGGSVPLCVRHCASGADCAPGFGCLDADADPSTPAACVGGCVLDADCRTGESCDASARGGLGRCVADGTCGQPVDLAAVAVERDGWLEVDRCREPHPLMTAVCVGATEGSASYVWTAPEDGLLLVDAGPAAVALTTECVGTTDARCLRQVDPAVPTSGASALPITEGKRVILQAQVDPEALAASERCTAVTGMGASALRSPLRIRLMSVGEAGAPCDTAGDDVRCAAGLFCFDSDGSGPRCQPPPECDAPIDLELSSEDGLLVHRVNLREGAPGPRFYCPGEPTPPDLTLPLRQVTFRFTAPSRGRLLATVWPFDPFGSGAQIAVGRADGARLALVSEACTGAAGALPTTACVRTEGLAAPPVLAAELEAGESVYLVLATTEGVYPVDDGAGLVTAFQLALGEGDACELGPLFVCPAGTGCGDPEATGARTCLPPAGNGEPCDSVLGGTACEPGLACVTTPGAPSRCMPVGGPGGCASPVLFGAVATPAPDGSGWLVHNGTRATGSAGPLPRSCSAMSTVMAREIVYRIVPPVSGVLVARTDLYNFGAPDTVLEAYRNCALPTSALGCNDDITSGELRSRLSVEVTGGTPIDLVVDAYSAAVEPEYVLSVQVLPPVEAGLPCDMMVQTDACVPPLVCRDGSCVAP